MRARAISRRLTMGDAIEIWRRRRSGEAQHRIAAAFDVNQGRVSEIFSGRCFPTAGRLAQDGTEHSGAAPD